MTTLKHTDGREIHLDDKTNDPPKLRNQLMLLGMNGLAYSEIYNKIAKKLNKLEKEDQSKNWNNKYNGGKQWKKNIK